MEANQLAAVRADHDVLDPAGHRFQHRQVIAPAPAAAAAPHGRIADLIPDQELRVVERPVQRTRPSTPAPTGSVAVDDLDDAEVRADVKAAGFALGRNPQFSTDPYSS